MIPTLMLTTKCLITIKKLVPGFGTKRTTQIQLRDQHFVNEQQNPLSVIQI